MNRKSKTLFTLGGSAIAGSVMAAAFTFAQIPQNVGRLFCSCADNMSFATELPMSHPINRCASAQAQVAEVSWSSWFSGQSNSNQFHFLDLLELLSRQSETPKDKSPA